MKLMREVDPSAAIPEMITTSPDLLRIFPTLKAPSFARSLKRCWSILEGQVSQGFVMERKPDARFARFGSTEILISVHPAHRRQGVATRALEQLLKKMDDVFVLVSPENPAALALFSGMKAFSQVHDLQQARVYCQDRMDSMDISCPSGPAMVPPLKHSSGTIVLS